MRQEEWMAEVERRLREARATQPQSLVATGQQDLQLFIPPSNPTEWFGEGEWIWISLNQKQQDQVTGEYFYGWIEKVRIVNTTGGYEWLNGEKFGALDWFPAIALNNDDIPINDGKRYPARWNPDTLQWIFFLRHRGITPPVDPCPLGVSWIINPPGFLYNYDYYSTGGCGGITSHNDGSVFYDTPSLLKSLVLTLVYDDTETDVYRAEMQCISGLAEWVVVFDRTADPDIQPLRPYDPAKSISLCYKYEYNNSAHLAIEDTSINWVDESGNVYANRSYYIGELTVFESGSPQELCALYSPETIAQNCSIAGPFPLTQDAGNLTLTVQGSLTGPDVDTPFSNTFKMMPIDYEIIPLSATGYYNDNAFTETYLEGLIQTFLNVPLLNGGDSTVCNPVSGFQTGAEKTYDCKVFKINPGFNVTSAVIGGISAVRVMDVSRTDVPCGGGVDDVASTLPTTIKHQGTNASVRPYSIAPIDNVANCTPLVPFLSGFDMSGGVSHALVNFGTTPFTYQSEEWWTAQLTGTTSRSGLNGRAGYRIKWRFEGPI